MLAQVRAMGRVVNMAEWRLALHAKVVTLDRSLYQKARQKVLGRVLPAVINSLIKEFTNDLQQADTARRGRAKVIASHKEIVGFSNSNKDWLHLLPGVSVKRLFERGWNTRIVVWWVRVAVKFAPESRPKSRFFIYPQVDSRQLVENRHGCIDCVG